jgi:hypothetical protein
MFEDQYNEEMVATVRRLEARQRAAAAGHPEWCNACARCGAELTDPEQERCPGCATSDHRKER